MSRGDYLIRSATYCDTGRDDDKDLWIRYLGKEYDPVDDHIKLTQDDIAQVLASDQVLDWQKALLLEATTDGTELNRFVRSLRKPADTSKVDRMIADLKARKGGKMFDLFEDLQTGLMQAIEMERNRPKGGRMRKVFDGMQETLRRAVEAEDDEVAALKEVQAALKAAVADLDTYIEHAEAAKLHEKA